MSNGCPIEIEIEIEKDIEKEIKIDIESEVDIGEPATENGSYTECIQNVYSLDTQISIDKIRLDKNRLNQKRLIDKSSDKSSDVAISDKDKDKEEEQDIYTTTNIAEKNIFYYYPSQAKILNYIFSRKNPRIWNKNRNVMILAP